MVLPSGSKHELSISIAFLAQCEKHDIENTSAKNMLNEGRM